MPSFPPRDVPPRASPCVSSPVSRETNADSLGVEITPIGANGSGQLATRYYKDHPLRNGVRIVRQALPLSPSKF